MQALDIYQVCNLTTWHFHFIQFLCVILLTGISLSAKIQILCVVYFMKPLISGLHLVGNLTSFKVLITCKIFFFFFQQLSLAYQHKGKQTVKISIFYVVDYWCSNEFFQFSCQLKYSLCICLSFDIMQSTAEI